MSSLNDKFNIYIGYAFLLHGRFLNGVWFHFIQNKLFWLNYHYATLVEMTDVNVTVHRDSHPLSRLGLRRAKARAHRVDLRSPAVAVIDPRSVLRLWHHVKMGFTAEKKQNSTWIVMIGRC